jgi:hypothetical protein
MCNKRLVNFSYYPAAFPQHTFEDFLDLRKETGDDRRRTHNMNTAHWIPDLFMKRLKAISDVRFRKMRPGRFFVRMKCPIFQSFMGAHSRSDTDITRASPMRENCGAAKFACSLFGNGCSRCSLRPDIRGSRGKIQPTCVTRKTTAASSTIQISAPKLS